MMDLGNILGRSDERPTRWHSRRGRFASSAALRTLPAAILARITGRSDDEPWLAPMAVKYLNHVISRRDVVLEFGGGRSSAWLAQRAGSLITIEPEGHWFEVVSEALAPHSNASLVCRLAGDVLHEEFGIEPTVVLVDHLERPDDLTRPEVVLRVAQMGSVLRIILDDSDRAQYDLDTLELLLAPRFSCVRMSGFRASPLHLTETSVFERVRTCGADLGPA